MFEAPTTTEVPSDGVLVLGALLPQSGRGATFGDPLIQAFELAVDEVNAAGGINGVRVAPRVADEGADLTTASKGAAELVSAGADVIIGPASSNAGRAVIGRITGAGRGMCSPTNTSIALGKAPDRGLYYRTIASDALQATAMAGLVSDTGESRLSIVYTDDQFGRDYLDAFSAALPRYDIDIDQELGVDPASPDLKPIAREVLGDSPSTLVVIGNDTDGSRMLATLNAVDMTPPKTIVVNDAMRDRGLINLLGTNPTPFIESIVGVSPETGVADSPAGAHFAEAFAAAAPQINIDYGAYAYDCVIITALAAIAAGTDQPSALAQKISEVTRSGQPCTSFAECRELLAAGRNIDYDGASGRLELNSEGDPQSVRLEQFGFDQTGRDILIKQVTPQ